MLRRGEGFQVVAVFTTANVFAKKYQERCAESIEAQDEVDRQDSQRSGYNLWKPTKIELAQIIFKDETLSLEISWGHSKYIRTMPYVLAIRG